MRITTNAILRNYSSNLSASMVNVDTMRTRVMTGRKFSKASEDPASALRAANLERKYAKNLDFQDMVADVQSFQDAQEDAAMQINNIAITLSKDYGIEALNGTNGALTVRQTYADAWRGSMESMVQSLNATYEDKFVFAGSDGNAEVPFKLDADGNLTYRGENVTTSDAAALQVLDELSEDSVYVDLGFGLEMKNQETVEDTSAFNTSLPGINVVGYGTVKLSDGTEVSNNMVVLAGQIADVLEEEPFNYEKYKEMLGIFDGMRDVVLENVTTLGTKTEFLTNTRDRLETNELNLVNQYDNMVNVDMAEAIMDYSWAQYVYNASLKVGTSILSPSFIDYMK